MLRYEACVEIRVLRQQGKSLRDIAVEMGLAVNPVRKYLAVGVRPSYQRTAVASKLEPFADYLRGRVAAAAPDWIPARVLWREIREQGFAGSERTVQRFVKALNRHSVGTTRYWKLTLEKTSSVSWAATDDVF